MLSIEGNLRFYYLPTFTDMRFKHDRIAGIIREQLMREPEEGDIYMIMSRDRCTVRLFSFEEHAVMFFEKKFKKGYKFMQVVNDHGEVSYRIRLEDVRLLLGCPVIKKLRINPLKCG